MPHHDSTFDRRPDVNRRYTADGNPESNFRQQIRDILDLSWDARDARIYEELRRLKHIADVVGPDRV